MYLCVRLFLTKCYVSLSVTFDTIHHLGYYNMSLNSKLVLTLPSYNSLVDLFWPVLHKYSVFRKFSFKHRQSQVLFRERRATFLHLLNMRQS